MSQRLQLSGSLMAGYDDNFNAERADPTQLRAPQRVSTAFSDVSLSYLRGRNQRSFGLDVRGFASGDDQASRPLLWGAQVRGSAVTSIGRRTRASVSQLIGRETVLVLGGFSPLDNGSGSVPASSPVASIGSQLAREATSRVDVAQQWTSRTTTSAGYGYDSRWDATGYRARVHMANVGYDNAFTRSAGLNISYMHSSGSYIGRGVADEVPMVNGRFEAGIRVDRAISPTRSIAISGGTGVMLVRTQDLVTAAPLEYQTPSGYGSARVDLGRTWALTGDYRRGVTLLEEISLESFVADSAMLRAGGSLGGSLGAALSFGHSNSRPNSVQPHSYETTIFGAQMTYQLSRTTGLAVNYNRYSYNLHGIVTGPGIQPNFARNAIRIGLTFGVPLIGPRGRAGNGRN